jgi:fatty-acyl-CoA synthase
MNRDLLYKGVYQPQLLVHALSHHPNRPVIHLEDGRVVTAGDLKDETSRYCQALAAIGLPPQARIGILSGNRLEMLHVTNASMLNQLICVPLYPRGSLDDWTYIAEDAELDALVFEPSVFDESAAILRTRVPHMSRLIAMGPSAAGIDLVAAAAQFTPCALPNPLLHGDEIFRLSYSGGTTGKPKAIVGSHTYAMTTLTIQLCEWEYPKRVRQLLCAPLSHSGAAVIMPSLVLDGEVWIHSGFDPLKVLQAIHENRITCILLVPTMIYALMDHPRFNEFDLSSLETIFYGASPISPARLREAIEKFGPVFFQFYGQAEAPMAVTVLRKEEHEVDNPRRLASCGRPVPWVHVALLNDLNREVPEGEPGELCVRGPLVMAGYLNKEQQTAEAFSGDWLHTGDIAVKDEDGFFRIVDRKKDMIISGGFNVYPREVEDVLSLHPSVGQCAVFGIPDAHWGEAVVAVVGARPGRSCPPGELMSFVREKKGPIQTPKAIIFVSSIPLTAVGKPDKKVLRIQYANFRHEGVDQCNEIGTATGPRT